MGSPKAIGIIPDGNRRYAEREDIGYREAYQLGMDKVEEVLGWCLEEGVRDVVFYGLSKENLAKRGSLDVVLEVYKEKIREVLSNSQLIHKHKCRVIFTDLVDHLCDEEIELMDATEDYGEHRLWVALDYGGRQELVDAVNNWTAVDGEGLLGVLQVPLELDLVIRTGGARRLSNFCLFQSAYAELRFLDSLWPVLGKEEFLGVLEDFRGTDRRFGE